MKTRFKIIMLIITLFLVACNSAEDPETSDEPSSSSDEKEIKIAFDTAPPTLDSHISTAAATREMSRPIYEGLVVLDSEYSPQPMLAESWDISEDGLTITFNLREGVKFHNGNEMTAEDVVASLNRWKDISNAARANFSDAVFEEEDDYTVVLKLSEPNTSAVIVLAGPTQYASIMPKEIIESADESGVTEHIGTGPYEMDEYVEDQYLTLSKFEDYESVSTPTDGLSGEKEVLIDTLVYEIVTDPSTRLTGLQTGEYDIATDLTKDSYEMLESEPDIVSHSFAHDFGTMIFNKKTGIFSDIKVRQAVLAALDMEEILLAADNDEFFYELEHGLASKEQTEWYSDAGKELYNQKDPEKAKKLLEEAGYDGEEIKLMSTRDIQGLYNASVTIQEQLNEIGMNVELELYDWSALLDRREDPDTWDVTFTSWPTEPVPSNYVFLSSKNEYAGWTESDKIDELVEAIQVAESQSEASELFAELQEEFYNYVPVIKYGDSNRFNANRENITGLDDFYGLIPWGIDIED